jgi:hypothetical protein
LLATGSASGAVPGYAPIVVTIVDANTLKNDSSVAVLANASPSGAHVRLVAYVSFFGETLGGQSVKSDEFSFPIDVCNGCLMPFSNNPAYPIPTAPVTLARWGWGWKSGRKAVLLGFERHPLPGAVAMSERDGGRLRDDERLLKHFCYRRVIDHDREHQNAPLRPIIANRTA